MKFLYFICCDIITNLLAHLQMGPHLLRDGHHLGLGHPLVDLLNEDSSPDGLSHRPQGWPCFFTFDRLEKLFWKISFDLTPVLDWKKLQPAIFAPFWMEIENDVKEFLWEFRSKNSLRLLAQLHLPAQPGHHQHCSWAEKHHNDLSQMVCAGCMLVIVLWVGWTVKNILEIS